MRRSLLIIIILVIAGCESNLSKVPFQDDIKEITNLQRVEYLRDELKKEPDNPSILLKIAQSYATENLDSAIYYGSLALENADDDRGSIYYSLAGIYKEANQPNLAIEHGLQAEESGLVSSELKNLIAEQYLVIKDYAKADLYLSQALGLADADQNAIFMQAQLDLVKGDSVSAITKLSALDERSLIFRREVLLGRIFLSLEQDSSAMVHLNLAKKEQPEDPVSYRLLSELYERAGDNRESINELKQIDPEYDDLMKLADLYYQELIWDSTFVYTDLAKDQNPEAYEPYLLEAKVYVGRRDFTLARNLYDSLIQADTTNVDAQEGLSYLNGRIQYLLRQQEEKKKQDSIVFRPLKIREF